MGRSLSVLWGAALFRNKPLNFLESSEDSFLPRAQSLR